MRIALVALFISFSLSIQSREPLRFFRNGKIVKVINFEQISNKIPTEIIKFKNPETNSTEEFKAFNFFRLLNLTYGPIPSIKEKFFLFGTTDGYVPITKGESFYSNIPYLAFDRADKDQFVTSFAGGRKDIQVGPYYLIWKEANTNLKSKNKITLPYGVKSVRLYDNLDLIQVPNYEKANVKEGYQLYKNHCISCHSIDGIGGTKGPYLFSVNLVEEKGKKWLAKYILYPKKVNQNSKMPETLSKRKDKILAAFAISDYMNYVFKKVETSKALNPTTKK